MADTSTERAVGIYSGDRFVDYPTLLGRVARAARGLANEGVAAGDRVAIVLRNEPAFLEASLAVATLGASPVPVNWHFRADEVGYILRDCAAKVVMIHEDLLGNLAQAIPEGVTIVALPTPPEVAAIYGPPPGATEKGVIYTSGTTGRPKGVLRDPLSDELRAQMLPVVMRVLGVHPGARSVFPAPLYHTAPNAHALAAASVGLHSEEALAHPGTVGRALPEASVRVLGEDDRELGPGEIGEVYMRLGPWPQFTYLGDPEKRASVERDGMISCGDVGYLDEDGFLYLCDRRSDMVISGGVNIYPAEIEACLLKLGGVRDCAVFGIPDEEFGEALAAHVEADPDAGLTADAVRDHIGAELARYKVPRVVEFDDALPREDSGKIFKRRLREPYWAGRERRI